jgi:hypothetical protein
MKPLHMALSAAFLFAARFPAESAEYPVRKIGDDLSKVPAVQAGYWTGVPELEVGLLAQMMTNPKPDKANTPKVKVQMVHDGKFMAFRLRWSDPELSEAGRLAEFSDAVALQFPVLDNAAPPPIFMGAPKNPVQIYHWRAQYQRDELRGMKTIKDVYPNMSTDIYPNEFPDRGRLKPATEAQTEMFVTGKAAGNPQSYSKKAVDEIKAEGFGTSAVIPADRSVGRGEWKDGEWTVVIARPLSSANGSILEQGKGSAFGVAVWQGGAGEVGARKCMTMVWSPFKLEEASVARNSSKPGER